MTRREFLPILAGMAGGAMSVSTTVAAEYAPAQRERLLGIERDCLRYFLDNQTEHGLFLDRQRNNGDSYDCDIPCSMAATGMGFIALALAAQKDHNLLSRTEAVERCKHGMETALTLLPEDHGILPHFVIGSDLKPWGFDVSSTIDTAWCLAGASTAAELLDEDEGRRLAARLRERADWLYWTNGNGRLISHGKNDAGQFLCHWNRLNGETAFMYILAAGAEPEKAISPDAWSKLEPCMGEAEGLMFASADLGLFTHQVGNHLIDLVSWQNPHNIDLLEHARLATKANILASARLGEKTKTFRTFWGISDGDCPGTAEKNTEYQYRPNTIDNNDGTAHIASSIAAIEYDVFDEVMRNIDAAEAIGARGRYGFNNVNLDQKWMSTDAVGFDVGNPCFSIENALHENRIRRAFHAIPDVQRGLARQGFRRAA